LVQKSDCLADCARAQSEWTKWTQDPHGIAHARTELGHPLCASQALCSPPPFACRYEHHTHSTMRPAKHPLHPVLCCADNMYDAQQGTTMTAANGGSRWRPWS
jgi:hypothetical protein